MRAAPRKLAAPVLIVGLFLAGACEKTTTPAPAGVDTTLVVVVDDFGGPYANAHEEGSDRGDKKDNCAYAGIPSNDVESGGATGTALPSGTTHGAMVASVLIDEINRKLTPATPSTMAPYGSASVGYIGDAYKWSSGSRELVVQKISVKRYKIEPMIQRVERVLQDSGFEHVIFNFSFIVAPCNIADWFATGSKTPRSFSTSTTSSSRQRRRP
jgi:hypothetical protein